MAEGVLEGILGGEPEAEGEVEALSGPDPIAVSAAMEAARHDPELAERLGSYVDEQARLVRLQSEHLHEQRTLVLSHLRWRRFGDRMKAVLQIMTAAVGLAIAAAIGWMAWDAHESNGLVIEPFSTPPEFAARGLSGQAVASRLLDGVQRLQDDTLSPESPKALKQGWTQEARVEIPETGVSVAELQSLFRSWLGHETRVSGEITRSGDTVVLTLRAGGLPVDPVSAPAAAPEALFSKASEELYGATEPERFGRWLSRHHRAPEAIAIYRRLAISGARRQRARALTHWGAALGQLNQPHAELAKYREALRLDPDQPSLWSDIAAAQQAFGRWELALVAARRAATLFSGPRAGDYAAWYVHLLRGEVQATIADLLSEPLLEASISEDTGDPAPDEPVIACRQCAAGNLFGAAQNYAAVGDGPGARLRMDQAVQTLEGDSDPQMLALAPLLPRVIALNLAVGVKDWPAVLRGATDPALQSQLSAVDAPSIRAVALAHLGRTAEGLALVRQAPPDCYPCAAREGEVRALAGDWPGAEAAFARAFALGPSLPLAHDTRGASLLARGDAAGAVQEAKTSVRLAPHDGAAKTLWGEALLKSGEYEAAARRFADADKDAPRLGRNHLLWGEALMLAGRHAQARAQFVAADGMDLSRPDRAALNVLLARTASGRLHG